jgi:hypothetical protein
MNGTGDVHGADVHSGDMIPGNEYVAVGAGRGGHDEGDGDGRGGGGDYQDHLNQQGQGNTKKRKVPANVGSSPPQHHHHHHHHLHHYSSHHGLGYGHTASEEGDVNEFSFGVGFGLDVGDDNGDSGLGGVESDVFGPLTPGSKGAATAYQHHHHQQMGSAPLLLPWQFHRKAKLSRATLAGLQRKELIRSRKKQLEIIMGTLGNTSALDHALSANFPPLLSSFSPSSSLNSSSSSSSSVVDSNSHSTDDDHGHEREGPTFVRTGGGGGGESRSRSSEENYWDVGWGWGGGADSDGKDVRVRLSRREKMRDGRIARMGVGRLGRHPDAAPFPTQEFTFTCPSASEFLFLGVVAKLLLIMLLTCFSCGTIGHSTTGCSEFA